MSIDILENTNKIPIVVGVTGHRNIVKDDYSDISAELRKGFEDIIDLCKTEKPPIILLTGLAQGADMLTAKIAREYDVAYVAVLPCPLQKFRTSFDDEDALAELDDYISHAADVVIVEDIEKDFANQPGQDEDSYRYRQVGIYIAQHSSLLFALWDGKPPKSKYGCGTTDVVDMALNHSYVKHMTGPHFGMPGDCAVNWIKCRREGDGSEKDVRSSYLLPSVYHTENDQAATDTELITLDDEGKYQCLKTARLPDITKEIITRTVEYNSYDVDVASINSNYRLLSANEYEQTSEYQKRLHRHYLKADALSGGQKKIFIKAVWCLAILGMLIAASFMLYDELGWNWLSLPCGAIVIAMIAYYFIVLSPRNQSHRKFLAWRALTETLRAQFYISVCGVDYNICDSFTWMQKNDVVWIDRAIAALSLGNISNTQIDLAKVKDKWLGTGTHSKDDGQYGYHSQKGVENGNRAKKHSSWSTGLMITTIALYAIIFVMELLTLIGVIDWLDFGVIWSQFTVRKILQILFGVLTVVSFLITASLGKLSYDRQKKDNYRMKRLYFTALNKWDADNKHFEQLVITLAREEIVENGVWLSYMLDNSLEITV
ncbi:MAG: hypothetical protein J1F66_01390 [Clostridiales bacterium]|nr:hypothetical protein [Clostridiales bacterium]